MEKPPSRLRAIYESIFSSRKRNPPLHSDHMTRVLEEAKSDTIILTQNYILSKLGYETDKRDVLERILAFELSNESHTSHSVTYTVLLLDPATDREIELGTVTGTRNEDRDPTRRGHIAGQIAPTQIAPKFSDDALNLLRTAIDQYKHIPQHRDRA